jgi:hypothetical protein
MDKKPIGRAGVVLLHDNHVTKLRLLGLSCNGRFTGLRHEGSELIQTEIKCHLPNQCLKSDTFSRLTITSLSCEGFNLSDRRCPK